jgi:hypothetical protein
MFVTNSNYHLLAPTVIDLMKVILELNPEETMKIVFAHPGEIEKLFLQGPLNVSSLLTLFTPKAVIFETLVGIFDSVDSLRTLLYFKTLKDLLNEDCNVRTILDRTKGLLSVDGVCDFLMTAFRQFPTIPLESPQLLAELLPLAFSSEKDEVVHSIFSLLKSALQLNSGLLEVIPDSLVKEFSKEVPVWGYDPQPLTTNAQVGLRNLGATCYLNSVLQQLFYNPDFRHHV